MFTSKLETKKHVGAYTSLNERQTIRNSLKSTKRWEIKRSIQQSTLFGQYETKNRFESTEKKITKKNYVEKYK